MPPPHNPHPNATCPGRRIPNGPNPADAMIEIREPWPPSLGMCSNASEPLLTVLNHIISIRLIILSGILFHGVDPSQGHSTVLICFHTPIRQVYQVCISKRRSPVQALDHLCQSSKD